MSLFLKCGSILLHFHGSFTINVLQAGGWIQQLAAHPPSRSSTGTRHAPACTAYPCSWDAHRRSRHLQTLCRSGLRGCASAHGRQACCLPPPLTDLQSLASPKPSASMNFPPARKTMNIAITLTCSMTLRPLGAYCTVYCN